MARVYTFPCAVLLLACGQALAIDRIPLADIDVTEAQVPMDPVAVSFRGQEVLTVRAPLGAMTIAERAQAIGNRLDAAFGQKDLKADALRTEMSPGSVDLYLGAQFIVSVTDADAQLVGRTRRQLAADHAIRINRLVADDLAARSVTSLLVSAAWAVAAILIALAAVWASMGALARVQLWLTRLAKTKVSVLRVGTLTLFSPAQVLPVVSTIVNVLRWLIAATIILTAAAFALNQFPWTQGIGAQTTRVAMNAVRWAGGGIASFLPNILYISVIVVATSYLLKLLHAILEQLGRSRTAARGFPPEWVRPTYQIVRFMVIALALVVMFPYLPGSGSKAFQGVSVFVGLVLSLGSASAIANIIAGLVLIYMRALKPGDRVKVADTVGDVISCDLLAMKVRTIKNVEVSVPNSLILANHIVNYSRMASEGQLILHTTVTIGYDVEWRRVEELLIKAALATKDVAKKPEPFVLQISLDDHYVSYELNVYTKEAQQMASIYSGLHANIQDAFNEAGIEIMSPGYSAVRDGNRTALPDKHLPKNYRQPVFGLSLLRPKTGET